MSIDNATLGQASTPILANRLRALPSKMMSLAVAWRARRDPINPAHAVEKFPERSRERFLSADEINRLERNGMRWNRVRFHLIPFPRTGDRGSTGHDGFG